MANSGLPIQVAARRTGLSPDTLRVWEKRYRAVEPLRTPSGRRLYREADLARLHLLRQATLRGWRIHDVAGLDDDRLASLIREDRRVGSTSGGSASFPMPSAVTLRERCLEAVLGLDVAGVRSVMNRALLELGGLRFLEEFLAPVFQEVGAMWQGGELHPHQEHLLSSVTAGILDTILSSSEAIADPLLLVTTPAGQKHEIGARLVAATAAVLGWGVVYLGPDLPAGDICSAARKRNVRAVALSLVYPETDPKLGDVLRQISEGLPPGVPLIVGGRASAAFADLLDAAGAARISDLSSFGMFLNQLGTGFHRGRES